MIVYILFFSRSYCNDPPVVNCVTTDINKSIEWDKDESDCTYRWSESYELEENKYE